MSAHEHVEVRAQSWELVLSHHVSPRIGIQVVRHDGSKFFYLLSHLVGQGINNSYLQAN